MRVVEWDSIIREIDRESGGSPYKLSVEIMGGASMTGSPYKVDTRNFAILRMDMDNGKVCFIPVAQIVAVVVDRVMGT